jgi:hypothetical protein
VVWEGRSREAPPYPDPWHTRDRQPRAGRVRLLRRTGHYGCGAVMRAIDPTRTLPRRNHCAANYRAAPSPTTTNGPQSAG